MPYDPTYPALDAEMTASELRAQLNALHDKIVALEAAQAQMVSVDTVLNLFRAYAARNVDGVAQLPPPWSSNPPERDEFNEVRDKVNELVSGLVHPA